ncbi:helix-turn-helix transcriptional regulator [Microbacterium sp. 4R-513]|uniref:winged helix-turn-helix transcriptional regulator n=1 Tax=Microbacterium sp. 4R-513 TaxID=2567934 RepID=UPI0013E10B39|nr:helix-turn-helix domain-containing protein [Microbacterium sp. 4R-513]QIG39893.1 helix-turn-helix transcriptional regulator [Microbacterium sp. 4R-513]
MMESQRSGCPINLSLEVIGDKWSLLVIRDMMFGNRRHFRELLLGSEEGIASNILADRLQRLVDQGLISRAPHPTHKQKVVYSLTEPAIQLVPVLVALGSWGRRHLPVSRELAIRAELLERGGPEMWDAFMDELREQHLGIRRRDGARSVLAELREAYLAEVAAAAAVAAESAAVEPASERAARR